MIPLFIFFLHRGASADKCGLDKFKDVKNPSKLLKYAKALSCAGRYSEAEKKLKRAKEKFEKAGNKNGIFLAEANLGYLNILMERYDFAVMYLKRAIELNSKDPRVWGNLGIAYRLYGDIKLAKNAFDKALELDPYSPYWYVQRGIANMRLGLHEEAKSDFVSASQLDNLSPYPFIGLGLLAGDTPESITYLKEAMKRVPEDPDIPMLIAVKLHSKGELKEAGRYYNIAIKLLDRKEDLAIADFFSSAVSRDIGEYITAREKLKAARILFPELATVDPPYFPPARYALALRYLEAGNLKAAEAEAKSVVELDPKFSKAYFLIGKIKLKKAVQGLTKKRLKELKEARKTVEKGLEIVPGNIDGLYLLGLINWWLAKVGLKYQRTGSLIQSMSALAHAIKLEPTPEVLRLASIVSYEMTKYDDTIKYAEALAKEGKSDRYLDVLLARAYFMTKKLEKSETVLKDVLRKHPKFEPAIWALYELYSKTGRKDEAQKLLR